MSLVTLKMKHEDWDNVKLIVSGDNPTIIPITKRRDVESLHYVLSLQTFEHPDEPIQVSVAGREYILEVPVWTEMVGLLDDWFFMDFAPVEYDGEFLPTERDLTAAGTADSAQVIEFAHYQ